MGGGGIGEKKRGFSDLPFDLLIATGEYFMVEQCDLKGYSFCAFAKPKTFFSPGGGQKRERENTSKKVGREETGSVLPESLPRLEPGTTPSAPREGSVVCIRFVAGAGNARRRIARISRHRTQPGKLLSMSSGTAVGAGKDQVG